MSLGECLWVANVNVVLEQKRQDHSHSDEKEGDPENQDADAVSAIEVPPPSHSPTVGREPDWVIASPHPGVLGHSAVRSVLSAGWRGPTRDGPSEHNALRPEKARAPMASLLMQSTASQSRGGFGSRRLSSRSTRRGRYSRFSGQFR